MSQVGKVIVLSALLVIGVGCRNSNNSAAQNNAAATPESTTAFLSASQGNWQSNCTTLTSLNIPSIKSTVSGSSKISMVNFGNGKVTLNVVSYPSKADCTLNPQEIVFTDSKDFNMTVVTTPSDRHATVTLTPIDACDATTYSVDMSVDNNSQNSTIKILGGQFRLSAVTNPQPNAGACTTTNLDAVQKISATSPVLTNPITIHRTL